MDRQNHSYGMISCPLPWNSACLQPWGVTLCCASTDDMRSSRDETLDQILSNEKYTRVRSTLKKGEWPHECRGCRALEEKGLKSLRTNAIARGEKPIDNGGISYLELSFDNQCNLKCRMCTPLFSKKWREDIDALKETPEVCERMPAEIPEFHVFDGFLESILPRLRGLETLMLKGGEPTLNKRLLPFLESLIELGVADSCFLQVVTNGTNFDPRFFDVVRTFKKAEIIVSIDGVDPWHQYIRSGNYTYARVRENIGKIARMGFDIGFSTTYQIYNMLSYADLFDDLAEYSDRFYLVVVQNYGMKAESAPDSVRNAAVENLQAALQRFRDKPMIVQIFTDLIGMLKRGRHDRVEWEYAKKLTETLDGIRGTDFKKVDPEVSKFLLAPL